MNERATTGRRTSGKAVVAVIAVLVVAAVSVVLYFRVFRADEGEVRAIDPAERARLYERELRTFQELCASEPRVESPRNCEQAAQLLEGFPECDASCRQTIERFRETAGR